jgi:hypothetical protein
LHNSKGRTVFKKIGGAEVEGEVNLQREVLSKLNWWCVKSPNTEELYKLQFSMPKSFEEINSIMEITFHGGIVSLHNWMCEINPSTTKPVPITSRMKYLNLSLEAAKIQTPYVSFELGSNYKDIIARFDKYSSCWPYPFNRVVHKTEPNCVMRVSGREKTIELVVVLSDFPKLDQYKTLPHHCKVLNHSLPYEIRKKTGRVTIGSQEDGRGNSVQSVTCNCENSCEGCELIRITWDRTCETLEFLTVPVTAKYTDNHFFLVIYEYSADKSCNDSIEAPRYGAGNEG